MVDEENKHSFTYFQITYVVPEQQAAERTLTAETEKLKKHKGQVRQSTERQWPKRLRCALKTFKKALC